MVDQPGRWDLVGSAIEKRRKYMGLTKAQLIRESGVSFTTLRDYIDGRPIVREDKMADLQRALDWPPDMIERIAFGGLDPEDAATLRVVVGPKGTELTFDDLVAALGYLERRVYELEGWRAEVEARADLHAETDELLRLAARSDRPIDHTQGDRVRDILQSPRRNRPTPEPNE